MLELKENIIFKALSEPIRLRIVVLLTKGELCVCDLTEILSLPQSTISRHMSRLKTAGMVADRREGRWIHYRLKETDNVFINSLKRILFSLQNQPPYKDDLSKLAEISKKIRCSP
ncbi:MAG: winged helix-turn-helix transcriptional regulator [FCB group bacterium]|nr:winged helix-turn-helix transcriptional regulator [FCB group bacterium]